MVRKCARMLRLVKRRRYPIRKDIESDNELG